ncbi:hypothetical protein KI387_028254, partial [Taxus chinensis]
EKIMAKNASDTEMGVMNSNGSGPNYENGTRFSIEEASAVKLTDLQDDNPKTAHTIDHDPWYQLGVLLAVSFNCGYILGFSNLIMKPLGWIWGPILMAVLAVISVYANWLLAKLHIIDGRRFIRYRDLMGYAFVCFIHFGEYGISCAIWKGSEGMSNSKDYKLYGTKQEKIFNGFNAIAAIIFTNNSGMVPELQ